MDREEDETSVESRGTAIVTGPEGKTAPVKRKSKPGADKVSEQPAFAGGVRAERRSFFEVYKRGQGYYTRMGTAVGGGVLVLAGGHFLYGQLLFDTNASWTLWVQTGIPLVFVVLLGVLLFWAVGVNRTTCDFLIATEGEMKKVSWSNRRELIGSTKVVILFTVLLSALLFVVDVLFMTLFAAIKVLKVAPSVIKMFTGEL